MTKEQAQIILESLLGRLRPDNGLYRLPDGVLSEHEINAIRTVGDLDSSSASTTTAGKLPGIPAPAVLAEPRHRLNLASVDRDHVPTTDTRLCLDFGTAMSKGWCWSNDMGHAYPLLLGKRAGEGDDAAVVSSLFIRRDGTVLFGGAAEQHHIENGIAKGARLDNLKRRLSEGFEEVDPDRTQLDAELNPTDVPLSYGDAIQLYLAFLTDLAVSDFAEVNTSAGGRASSENAIDYRYIQRRFAMPCFAGKRETAARKWLHPAFLRAQILADTLHGKWSDGLRARDLVGLLDEVKHVAALPEYLLAHDAAVKEPIGAVAMRVEDFLDGRPARRLLLMVIDAGAGTTDFAMFHLNSSADGGLGRVFTISPTVTFTPVAGNRVDDALRDYILQSNANRIGPSVMGRDDWSLVNAELNNRIRGIKEGLLRGEHFELTFGTGHKVELLRDAFLECQHLSPLRGDLEKTQERVLSSLGERFYQDMAGREQSVIVLLTGGTSQLPMYDTLANRRVQVNGVDFQMRPGPREPNWMRQDAYGAIRPRYAQLAVAIGGAARELPEEAGSLEAAISSAPPGVRRLERYPTKGV